MRLHDLCISRPSTATSLGELVFTRDPPLCRHWGAVGVLTMTHPVGPGAAGEGGCGFPDPQACLSLGRTQHLRYILGWPLQSLSRGLSRGGKLPPEHLRRTPRRARISCEAGGQAGLLGSGNKPETAEAMRPARPRVPRAGQAGLPDPPPGQKGWL